MEIPCCGFTCPVEATLRLVGGKYKAVILWHLMDAGTTSSSSAAASANTSGKRATKR